MTILRTQRLILAPFQPSDEADAITLELDPDVMRYLNGGAVDHANVTPEDATFLMPRGADAHVWTARRTDGDKFVGWFCLYPDSGKSAEIGYRLRRSEWGQGLAFEGASALVDWGFTEAGYETISATTMAVNRASRCVMEKLGMAHRRTDYPEWADSIPGSEHGEVWYEITRSGWTSRVR